MKVFSVAPAQMEENQGLVAKALAQVSTSISATPFGLKACMPFSPGSLLASFAKAPISLSLSLSLRTSSQLSIRTKHNCMADQSCKHKHKGGEKIRPQNFNSVTKTVVLKAVAFKRFHQSPRTARIMMRCQSKKRRVKGDERKSKAAVALPQLSCAKLRSDKIDDRQDTTTSFRAKRPARWPRCWWLMPSLI